MSGKIKKKGVYRFTIRAKSCCDCETFSFRITVYARIPIERRVKWVAVGIGSSSESIKYSVDGINWTGATGDTFPGFGFGVASDRNNWVAVGQDITSSGKTIKYSIDGINWTGATGDTFITTGYGVSSDGKTWVAVGQDNNNSGKTIKYSTDGINWTGATGDTFPFVGRGVSSSVLTFQ